MELFGYTSKTVSIASCYVMYDGVDDVDYSLLHIAGVYVVSSSSSSIVMITFSTAQVIYVTISTAVCLLSSCLLEDVLSTAADELIVFANDRALNITSSPVGNENQCKYYGSIIEGLDAKSVILLHLALSDYTLSTGFDGYELPSITADATTRTMIIDDCIFFCCIANENEVGGGVVFIWMGTGMAWTAKESKPTA